MLKRPARPYPIPSPYFGDAKRARTERIGSAREILSKQGAAMLAMLAGGVSLTHTAKQFPHVINKLALHVHQPLLMVKAVEEFLLPDDHQKREGFPFETVEELGNLKALYSRNLSR